MAEIVSKPAHGTRLVNDEGEASGDLQAHLDDLEQKLNSDLFGDRVRLTSYAVADVPDATTGIGIIFVSDETGGATIAFSDGTNWRRSTDLTVISS